MDDAGSGLESITNSLYYQCGRPDDAVLISNPFTQIPNTLTMPRTQLSESQIRFDRIFSVPNILASRGFHVVGEGKLQDTLVGENPPERFYEIFNDEKSRQQFQTHIEQNCNDPQFQDLTIRGDFSERRNKLSSTFEWYVGELLSRQFRAFSHSFGVNISDVAQLGSATPTGDYDALVVLRNLDLMYFECKMGSQSSNALTCQKIMNAVKRGLALHTAATVMFLEKGVHGGDLFRNLHDVKHPISDRTDQIMEIVIRGKPASVIYRWGDCYFLNANTRYGDVKSKLNTVFRIIQADQAISRIGASSYSAIPFSEDRYRQLGYDVKEIKEEDAG